MLSEAAAFYGCKIPVGVPVFGACQECGGTGEVFPFRCLECAGSGLVEEQRTGDGSGSNGCQAELTGQCSVLSAGIALLQVRIVVRLEED